jgi:hypothetical protein
MLAAALVFSLAAAQPAEPPPPPELAAAGEAWNECIQNNLEGADPELSPARVVDAAMGACRTRQDSMLAAHRRWVEGSALSERDKRQALRAMEQSLTRLRPQFIRFVRSMRED